MKQIRTYFIVLVFSFIYVGTVSANIEFTISVHQVKEKQEADKSISKEEIDYTMVVELGASYFSYTKDKNKYIYDFSNKRIFTVDLSNKIFADDSLYSNIGFRTSEFKNRLMLGGALAAGGIEDNPMLPVLSEHVFSLRQKDKKTELSRLEKDGVIYFSAAGKKLFSYGTQGAQVEEENKKMFIRFLRYVFGGHPIILEEMASANAIPASISVNRYNVTNEYNVLTISPIKVLAKRQLSLKGYKPGVLSSDAEPFSKNLHEIKYSKKINLDKYLESLLLKAGKFYQDRNYLDTMLVYLEYSLASGLDLPEMFQEQKAVLFQDDSVKKLLVSLNPKNRDEADQAVLILGSLAEKSKHQKPVIWIFEANTSSGLGNQEKAKELFYAALQTSPYITGAYKDFGDIYFSGYNAVLAWRCWDVARKINPKHKMLGQVSQFEERLEKDNPDFF